MRYGSSGLRRGASLLATSAVVIGLAGCAPADEEVSGGVSGGTTEVENKTLTIGMNSGLVPFFEEYAEAFIAENEGWDITVSPVPDAQPDYIQQLVTQNLSGSMPDLIFNYDTLNQTLAGNELVLDLTPYLEQDGGLSVDGFVPEFLNQYRVGDAITGLPVSADSGVLFYNRDVFARYGVDEFPEEDWTLEDLYRVAKEITDNAGGEAYGLVTPIGDSTAYFTWYPVLRAYGSEIYDPDSNSFVFANEAGIEAWTELLRPYTEGFGSPYSPGTDVLALFQSGQAAMQVFARPVVPTFREALADDWDVQRQPTYNGNSTTGGGSYSLSISSASPNPDGAWEFMSWFYSTDGGMAVAAPRGVVPATVDGLANGDWKNDTNPVPANLVAVTDYAVANAVLPTPIPDDVQPAVVPALREALERVVLQGVSVQDAYTAAQDELNALLG